MKPFKREGWLIGRFFRAHLGVEDIARGGLYRYMNSVDFLVRWG